MLDYFMIIGEMAIIAVLQHMKLAIILLACVIVGGVFGYMTLEGLSIYDAIYLVVTTISTVGYGDITPKTKAGRCFTVFLIIFGVGILFYTWTLAVSLVVEGRMKDIFGRREMKKRIGKLNQHVIICGAGKVGSNAILRLQQENEKFVVIDNNPAICERLEQEKIPVIQGDATMDEVLLEAGLLQAKGVIAALSGDANNVYITLTARNIRPDIFIVARADRPEAEAKMRRAGATSVVSPAVMGGRHMVNALTKPLIMDLLENVFYNQEIHLDMAQITIHNGSSLVGKDLTNSGIKTIYGAIVIAIQRGTEMVVTPNAEEKIRCDDVLILMGEREALNKLNQLAGNKS
jgi:voltage-gated potassium channel